MAHHVQCIREDTVPLCNGPYRIPIFYLEILLPAIRGGGTVISMYHFSEGERESETFTYLMFCLSSHEQSASQCLGAQEGMCV